MKKIMVFVVMMVMMVTFGCTTFAQSKIYVDYERNAVCIFDTEEDMKVVIFPEKIVEDYVVCTKVGLENDVIVTYVPDWPSKLGTIFDLNEEGELVVCCADEES
jgi:hypothetical protein